MWRFLVIARLSLIPGLVFAASPSASPSNGAAVVLLRPATTNAALAETLTRVQGELTADGFRVSALEVDGPPPRAELLALAAARPDAAALIGLFAENDGQTVELWVVDQLTGTAVVTRVEVSAANPSTGEAVAPEVLARRAVEVLRATLLKLSIVPAAVANRPPPPPPVPVPAKRPAATVPPVWGAEGGLGVLGAVDGLTPAVMPMVRLRFALGGVFMGRLSVAGFGSRPIIERAEGAADLDQQLVLIELVSWLSQAGTFRPVVELGAGAYHVAVNAVAAAPYRATRDDQWAFAAAAGAGLSVQLNPRWALALELHALLTAPYPVVRFVGNEVARLGRPTFLSTLTLAGWL